MNGFSCTLFVTVGLKPHICTSGQIPESYIWNGHPIFVKFTTKKVVSIPVCNKIKISILSSLIIILHDSWIMHTIYKCNAIILNQQRQHPVQYLHTFIQIIYITLILPNNIYASTKNLDIWNVYKTIPHVSIGLFFVFCFFIITTVQK